MQDRSALALRVAALGGVLFVLLVVLFNLGYEFKEPLLTYGFPINALAFHVGLGIALWARFGDAARRGRHALAAILANGLPVLLFWLFVYALVQALKTFT